MAEDELAAVIAGALVIQALPAVFLTLLGGVIAARVELRLILVREEARIPLHSAKSSVGGKSKTGRW